MSIRHNPYMPTISKHDIYNPSNDKTYETLLHSNMGYQSAEQRQYASAEAVSDGKPWSNLCGAYDKPFDSWDSAGKGV
ncbi:hypothetical protein SD71_05675 [Cohnella kolymensis]|uniref:Uncharacterized protein n=1 Tax=Cohnella kolymensis TaxID=1590652 RepID=A0ABR5A753_9BACL|nr:hypothetical protein [Cohnella kolymensis]KIL36881.1 hypothetical protein SD71_05675 [Cohnella kolymensis]